MGKSPVPKDILLSCILGHPTIHMTSVSQAILTWMNSWAHSIQSAMSWRKAFQNNRKCAFEFLIYYFWGRGQLLLICTILHREWNAAGLLLYYPLILQPSTRILQASETSIHCPILCGSRNKNVKFLWMVLLSACRDLISHVGTHFKALEKIVEQKLHKFLEERKFKL